MRVLIILVLPLLFGFTLPRGVSVEIVGESFVQNGLAMDIYYYRHRSTPEQFSNELRNILENKYSGEIVTKELDTGVYSVGLLTDKEYVSVTVQSASGGGTEGFLTKTNLKPKKIPDAPISLPDSMKLTSHTYDPLGRETWVYSSKRDVVWIRSMLSQHKLDQEHINVDGSALYSGVIGRNRLQISVSALDNGSSLVIVK